MTPVDPRLQTQHSIGVANDIDMDIKIPILSNLGERITVSKYLENTDSGIIHTNRLRCGIRWSVNNRNP